MEEEEGEEEEEQQQQQQHTHAKTRNTIIHNHPHLTLSRQDDSIQVLFSGASERVSIFDRENERPSRRDLARIGPSCS